MILSASFFWRNDKPGGLGVTFGPPGFTPEELTEMFAGETVRRYFADSDMHLGTSVVETYLAQLGAIAVQARMAPLPLQTALIAALNIYWLAERGFIPQSEHSGTQFVLMR